MNVITNVTATFTYYFKGAITQLKDICAFLARHTVFLFDLMVLIWMTSAAFYKECFISWYISLYRETAKKSDFWGYFDAKYLQWVGWTTSILDWSCLLSPYWYYCLLGIKSKPLINYGSVSSSTSWKDCGVAQLIWKTLKLYLVKKKKRIVQNIHILFAWGLFLVQVSQ